MTRVAIPDPLAEHANKRLLVDVRSGHFDEYSVDKLPLIFGHIAFVHMWEEVCAVEVLFDHPIRAHEEAKVLTGLGFPAHVVSNSEVKRKLLRKMLAEQAVIFPAKPDLKAVI